MAEDKNRVSLTINGVTFVGWVSVSIATNARSLARTFELQTTRSLRDGEKVQAITPGSSVVVSIGNDVVATGFITSVAMQYNSSSIGIAVSGAGKTVDLEDCTIPASKPRQYSNRTICEVLQTLCGYFGIAVVDEVGATQRSDFNAGVTDTIQQSIIKLLKSRAVLVSDDELGRLVISSVASAPDAADALEIGKNVLSASRKRNIRNRFYTYSAIGQQTNPLSENATALELVKTAVDGTFPRTERTKTFQLTGNADVQKLQAWIRLVRDQVVASSDQVVTYVVHGWRQSNGELWKKNTFVVVKDSVLGVNKRLFLSSVKYQLASDWMTTELTVEPANAFLVTDAPDKAVAKDTGGDLSGIIANSGKIK